MKPRGDNYLTFRAFALAADIPEKQLRNWLDRELICLDADERRGEGHRRFSELDVIRAALVERLSEFGSEVESASESIEHLFREVCGQQSLRYYPPSKRENVKIIEALLGSAIVIDIGRRVAVFQPRGAKEQTRIQRSKDFMIVNEKHVKTIDPSADGARLILYCGGIINAVYQRLEKIETGEVKL